MAKSKDEIFQILRIASIVFWDFDGVIKDSLDAKTNAFVALFRSYGESIAERVRQHHQANGGVSRFDKIPLYLSWAGKSVNPEILEDYYHRFSQQVFHAVVESPWVAGVREYLLEHHSQQYFVLVTATPQDEIENILRTLNIAHCFRECHGAPIRKAATIRDVLQRLHRSPNEAVFVGDTETDFNAAQDNNVPFLLRRTSLNPSLQVLHTGYAFDNLENS